MFTTGYFLDRLILLRECPMYEDQRHLLRAVSRNISLHEILGTNDGISALAEFLEESGAFTKSGGSDNRRTTPPRERARNRTRIGT